jgi:hypothetical protein
VHPTDFVLQSSSPDPAARYLLPKQSSGSLCCSTLLLVSFVYIYIRPFLACSPSAAYTSRPFTIAFSGVYSLIDHRLGVISFSITLPLPRYPHPFIRCRPSITITITVFRHSYFLFLCIFEEHCNLPAADITVTTLASSYAPISESLSCVSELCRRVRKCITTASCSQPPCSLR